MRAILFGAGGQLGVDLARECAERKISVLALDRSQLDITNAAAVRQLLESYRPEVVFNAAAYNKVDLAEQEFETALQINAAAVRDLAESCESVGATLLHYSTDLVFAGDKKTPHVESDTPKPLSFYGVSKVLGDVYASTSCSSYYVLRVSGVFGSAGRYSNHGNFPEFVLRRCAEGSPLQIVDDRFTNPTFGTALAKRSLDVLERQIPVGLYHLAGRETVSWYDFACRIAAAADCRAEITPISRSQYETPAPRPVNSALSCAKIEAAGIDPMPHLDDCIQQYMAQRERERPRSP